MKRIRNLWLLVPTIFIFGIVYGGEKGSQLYLKYCSSCHGVDRTGTVAPPLLPLFLKKYTDNKLIKIIKNGLPATQMPPFKNLKDDEIKAIISYIRKPASINWTEEKIKKFLDSLQ